MRPDLSKRYIEYHSFLEHADLGIGFFKLLYGQTVGMGYRIECFLALHPVTPHYDIGTRSRSHLAMLYIGRHCLT